MALIDTINHSVRDAVKKSEEEGRSRRDVLVMMTLGGATWLALETMTQGEIYDLFWDLRAAREYGGSHAQFTWPGLEADVCVLLTEQEPIQLAVVRGAACEKNDVWQVFDFFTETADA